VRAYECWNCGNVSGLEVEGDSVQGVKVECDNVSGFQVGENIQRVIVGFENRQELKV
jgi:hypothetical protein